MSTLSNRWLLPWVTVVDDSTLVAVMAIEEVAVEVRTLVNGTLVGPIRTTVPAGGRAIVPILTPGVDGAPIEVTATGPIAVEAVVVNGDSYDVVAAIPVTD